MNLITKNLIDIRQSCDSKQKVFEKIAEMAYKEGVISNESKVIEGLLYRESQTSTGLIDGFAIPHTQNECVECPGIVIIKNEEEIEWETLDGKNVVFIFAILVPQVSETNLHLKVLSSLSKKLMDDKFRHLLMNAKSRTEVLDLLEEVNQMCY